MNIAKIILAVAIALVSQRSIAAEGKTLLLENDQLAISIRADTGGVTEVHNKLSGETYRVDDPGFLVELGAEKTPGTIGRLTPANCKVTEAAANAREVVLNFSKGETKIALSYKLDPQDSFAIKRIRLVHSGEDYNVSRLEIFDLGLNPNPAKAIPYHGYLRPRKMSETDAFEKSVNSTAFFMRYAEGGLFTSVSCDFVAMEQDAKTKRCRSIYWPGLILKSGEAFESENGIIGVYRREGFFPRPYRETKDLDAFLFPNVDDRLDRAEIDAIRTAIQKFIKAERFAFVANGWAMGLPSMITNREALGQYKRAIELAQKFPQIDGLHFIHNLGGVGDEFTRIGLDARKINPLVDEALRYAESQGMGISAFLWTSLGQPAPKIPELLTLDKEGKRIAKNLALTRDYTGFVFDTFSRLGETYPHMMGLSCDFLSLRADYDPNHGYLPGLESLYPQYKNLRDMFGKLRERFPNWMLRTQAGFSGLGPWLSEHASFVHNSHDPNINVQRNFLDFHASYQYANNLRLASWYAANCKMFPRYMMNDFIVHKNTDYKAWDYGAWEFCVMSRVTAGNGFGMLNGKPDFDGGEIFPTNQYAFLDKWVTWQREHRDYYLRAASLFGEPRPTGVDGMAYGNGKDSVVFVCNPTFETKEVSIPITKEIHLPESGRYMVKELYPEERFRIGVNNGAFDYGSQFVTEIPAQTICAFEIKPLNPKLDYLLGIAGGLERSGGKISIRDVSGAAGKTQAFAIRLASSGAKVETVEIDGRKVSVQRSKDLLLGKIQFGGESVSRELADWKVGQRDGKTIYRAKFFVPESAREILAQQKLPVTTEYRGKQNILDTTAWLDWSRFIIHLPVLPRGANPDESAPYRFKAANDELPKAIQSFRPAAMLNGKKLEVHSNLMRSVERNERRDKATRWSGFFVDASALINFGNQNELTLEFPGDAKPGYIAGFLPNLTPQFTKEWKPLSPPKKLLLEENPAAIEVYSANPVVTERDGRATVYLKISLAGIDAEKFSAKQIAVEKGKLGEVTLLDAKQNARSGAIASVNLADSGNLICAQFKLEGSDETLVQLRTRDARQPFARFTLGEVLKAWRNRGDRFDSFALTLPGEPSVTVELSGPLHKKLAVRD